MEGLDPARADEILGREKRGLKSLTLLHWDIVTPNTIGCVAAPKCAARARA